MAARQRPGWSTTFVRAALALAIAWTPTTGALAQATQIRNNQARNHNDERQPAAQSPQPHARLIVPITGTLGTTPTAALSTAAPLEEEAAPTVTGLFSIQRFARTTDGRVAAVGTMTLGFTDPSSNAARTIVTQGAMPLETQDQNAVSRDEPQASAAPAAQGCETLSLVLGSVALNVPRQTIQLDEVPIDPVGVVGRPEDHRRGRRQERDAGDPAIAVA